MLDLHHMVQKPGTGFSHQDSFFPYDMLEAVYNCTTEAGTETWLSIQLPEKVMRLLFFPQWVNHLFFLHSGLDSTGMMLN